MKIHAIQSGKFRKHLSKSLNRSDTINYLCHKLFELNFLIEYTKLKNYKSWKQTKS